MKAPAWTPPSELRRWEPRTRPAVDDDSRSRGRTGLPETPAAQLLTARQLETLRLRAHGLTGKETAAAMGIEAQTVKNHVTAIYAALQVDNLPAALDRLGWLVVP